jgi:hypothetical protein
MLDAARGMLDVGGWAFIGDYTAGLLGAHRATAAARRARAAGRRLRFNCQRTGGMLDAGAAGRGDGRRYAACSRVY